MTKKKFEEAFVKFRKLVTENGFDLDINTQSKDITMTIRNPIDAVEQTSFIDVEEDKSSMTHQSVLCLKMVKFC